MLSTVNNVYRVTAENQAVVTLFHSFPRCQHRWNALSSLDRRSGRTKDKGQRSLARVERGHELGNVVFRVEHWKT